MTWTDRNFVRTVIRALFDAAVAENDRVAGAAIPVRFRTRARGATGPTGRFVAGDLDPYMADLLAEEMCAAPHDGVAALSVEIGGARHSRAIEIRVRG